MRNDPQVIDLVTRAGIGDDRRGTHWLTGILR